MGTGVINVNYIGTTNKFVILALRSALRITDFLDVCLRTGCTTQYVAFFQTLMSAQRFIYTTALFNPSS